MDGRQGRCVAGQQVPRVVGWNDHRALWSSDDGRHPGRGPTRPLTRPAAAMESKLDRQFAPFAIEAPRRVVAANQFAAFIEEHEFDVIVE